MFELLESARDLRIRSHAVKRFVCARGDDRDAQQISQVLDRVQGRSLIACAARQVARR